MKIIRNDFHLENEMRLFARFTQNSFLQPLNFQFDFKSKMSSNREINTATKLQ